MPLLEVPTRLPAARYSCLAEQRKSLNPPLRSHWDIPWWCVPISCHHISRRAISSNVPGHVHLQRKILMQPANRKVSGETVFTWTSSPLNSSSSTPSLRTNWRIESLQIMRHFKSVVLTEHYRDPSKYEAKTITLQPLPGMTHLHVMLVVASLAVAAVRDDSLTPWMKRAIVTYYSGQKVLLRANYFFFVEVGYRNGVVRRD